MKIDGYLSIRYTSLGFTVCTEDGEVLSKGHQSYAQANKALEKIREEKALGLQDADK